MTNTHNHNVPALKKNIAGIVAEYDEKYAAIDDEIKAFEESITRIEYQTTVAGQYVGAIFRKPYIHKSTLETNLLKSAWQYVFKRLNLEIIASAKDKKEFELAIQDPPPFTLDNIIATFGDYVEQPRYHILKGLAECFCDLDQAYKSHSKVKIGVEGLPKRIILSNVTGYGSWGRQKAEDTLNAINAYDSKPLIGYGECSKLLEGAVGEDVEYRGTTIRRYKNGNAHLIFSPDRLRSINLALAEFYGDVLPDTPDESPKKQQSTAVSKDLQFYPTPTVVIDRVLDELAFYDSDRVLEPSCGDGRILEALAKLPYQLRGLGVEVNAERATQAREKGFKVYEANFLEVAPKPDFDKIIMNPPFYGTHWAKHVDHAMKFLKPGGTLLSILPASAYYDHRKLLPKGSRWHDLPVASFHESGTNIPTGYIIVINGDY